MSHGLQVSPESLNPVLLRTKLMSIRRLGSHPIVPLGATGIAVGPDSCHF